MSTKGQDAFVEDQEFSADARRGAGRAHKPIGNEMNLAAKDPTWKTENLGEMTYVYTLWILKRMGNDSIGRNINRRGWVEQVLDMPLGDKGEDRGAISLNQWRWEMEELVLRNVFIDPIEVWGILTERDKGKKTRDACRELDIQEMRGQETPQSMRFWKR